MQGVDHRRADRGRPHPAHRHGAALPGQQVHADPAHRRPRAQQAHRRRLRPARRVRSRRHADRDRAVAHRHAGGGRGAAVQAHGAAIDLRGQHARARRRPPEDGQPQGGAGGVHRPPPRGDPAAQRVRPREGPRPRRDPRGPAEGDRATRLGDRDDPRLGVRGRGEDRADGGPRCRRRGAVALGAAGAGGAGHAAAPPRRARAAAHRGRARGARRADRVAAGSAREPGEDRRADQGRLRGAEGAVRRRAPHPGVRATRRGDLGGGPGPAPAHRRHDLGRRLHEARAAGDVPPPAPRRARDHRRADARRGRRQPPRRLRHARLAAALHPAGPRLLAARLRGARGNPPGAGHPRREPRGDGGDGPRHRRGRGRRLQPRLDGPRDGGRRREAHAAGAVRVRAPRRPDCDEAEARRQPDRGARRGRRPRRAADQQRRPGDPLPGRLAARRLARLGRACAGCGCATASAWSGS